MKQDRSALQSLPSKYERSLGRTESDSELSDHGDIGSGGEGLHEGLGAGLGDGSEVVDEVSLGH